MEVERGERKEEREAAKPTLLYPGFISSGDGDWETYVWVFSLNAHNIQQQKGKHFLKNQCKVPSEKGENEKPHIEQNILSLSNKS